MLKPDSSLKRIPSNTTQKQAFFIDGIRHSVEIVETAYNRLRENLTSIALSPPHGDQLQSIYPIIFLDAWAMVDAIDRFRMLYLQMPGMKFSLGQPNTTSLREATQPFRAIRNIADHLAQRADFVISKDAAALGTISWLTGFQIQPTLLWYCTIRPGTIAVEPQPLSTEIESKLDWPTGHITLSSGGINANLSDVLPHIKCRATDLESQLDKIFSRPEFKDAPIFNDVFTRQCLELKPGQFPDLDAHPVLKNNKREG